jgi:hypothetical protein
MGECLVNIPNKEGSLVLRAIGTDGVSMTETVRVVVMDYYPGTIVPHIGSMKVLLFPVSTGYRI